MLKVLAKEKVEEVKCEVTLRLIDGEPADELTRALVEFLPKEEEKVEEVSDEATDAYEPYPN